MKIESDTTEESSPEELEIEDNSGRTMDSAVRRFSIETSPGENRGDFVEARVSRVRSKYIFFEFFIKGFGMD